MINEGMPFMIVNAQADEHQKMDLAFAKNVPKSIKAN